MVKHTHQDFLIAPLNGRPATGIARRVITPLRRKQRLSGIPNESSRAVKLSHLDTYIDDESDWELFVASMGNVRRLVILDDRQITNPIMQAYDRFTKENYLRRLKQDGVDASIR